MLVMPFLYCFEQAGSDIGDGVQSVTAPEQLLHFAEGGQIVDRVSQAKRCPVAPIP